MRVAMKKINLAISLAILLALALNSLNVNAEETIASYAEKFQQRMDKMKDTKSSWTNEDKAIMQAASDALANELPHPGLQVGTKAPNFKLKNVFGKTIELNQELAKGPVILVFYRGSWCPYCNLHLHALKQSLSAFEKYGAQLITISPQSPDKSAEQVRKDGFPFEVLSDDTSEVMKSYKLYFQPPVELLALYKKHGLDLEEFNGEGRNGLPTPGAFIIDKSGIIRAMQAETDYKSRMEPQAIVDALATL